MLTLQNFTNKGSLMCKRQIISSLQRGTSLHFGCVHQNALKERWVGLYLCYDISHLRFGQQPEHIIENYAFSASSYVSSCDIRLTTVCVKLATHLSQVYGLSFFTFFVKFGAESDSTFKAWRNLRPCNVQLQALLSAWHGFSLCCVWQVMDC